MDNQAIAAVNLQLKIAIRPAKYGIVPYLAGKCCVQYWTDMG